MSAHFSAGFETGQKWTYGYTPGGPFRMTSCSQFRKELCDICKENHQQYKDWHEGFQAGKLFQPDDLKAQ